MEVETVHLKIANLPSDITTEQLKIILENKRKKGGGSIKCVEREGNSAIITFEESEAVNLILKRGNTVEINRAICSLQPLRIHVNNAEKLDNCDETETVTTKQIANNVSKTKEIQTNREAYYRANATVHDSSLNMPLQSTSSQLLSGPSSSMGKLDLNAGKNYEKKEKMYGFNNSENAEEKDLILFQRFGFCSEIEELYQHVKVDLDFENMKFIIKALDAATATMVSVDLLKLCMTFKTLVVSSSFIPEQLQLFQEPDVIRRINSLLVKKGYQAHCQYCSSTVKIHYVTDKAREATLKEVVESCVGVKNMNLSKESVLILQSEKGHQFLSSGLYDSYPHFKNITLVKPEPQMQHLLIIGPAEIQTYLEAEISNFLQYNKVITKNIHFPNGKQEFLKKFMKSDLDKISNHLTASGIALEQGLNQLILQGLSDGVGEGEKLLSNLSQQIFVQEVTLNYFGIQEYLQDHEGKLLLRGIEDNYSCIMKLAEQNKMAESMKSGSSVPTQVPVSHVQVGSCSIYFMHGDILDLTADAIVNPLDYTLKCSNGLARAIVSRGGHNIQAALDKSHKLVGPVIQTSSGHLNSFKFIIHLVCQVAKAASDVEKLGQTITASLRHATDKGFKTLALPAVGTSKVLKYSPLVACKALVKALHQFLEAEDSSLTTVFLCDTKADIVNTLIERFEAIAGLEEPLEKLDEATATRSTSFEENRASSGPREDGLKNFKHIHVHIVKGEITREKTNVIVITASKSLDLTKGYMASAVLKYGGGSLQQELRAKYKDGIDSGDFAQSSGGKLQCKHVFYTSLGHWRGNESKTFLSKLVLKLLTAAEKLKAASLSIPALGTGSLGFPAEATVDAITDAISEYARQNPDSTLRNINLVVFPTSTEIIQAFEAALSDGRGKKGMTHRSEGKTEGSHGRYGERKGHGKSGKAEGSYNHGGHGEGSNPGKSDYKSRPSQNKCSEQAVIQIYSNEIKKLEAASDNLHFSVKRAFRKEKEQNNEIKKLDHHKVKQLEEAGYQYGVHVSVKVEKGSIIIKGFKADGFIHVHKVLKNLEKSVVGEHYKSLQRVVAPAIQWQFLKNEKKWRDFDASLNSELEKEYKSKSQHSKITDPRGRKYHIDFKTMKEYPVDSAGKRQGSNISIRRCDILKNGEPLPKKWDPMPEKETFLLVTVRPHSEEYEKVKKNFTRGMPNTPIKKIKRIQNKALYQLYAAKKREMNLRNPRGHKNEKRLYHGTSSDSIPAINQNGFSRNYRGKNGTVFGNGAYFALSSGYSANFVFPDAKGNRNMYQARVLVGESTQSTQNMNFLPNKPRSATPYDSGHADEGGTEIYIIFHDAQAYPEYLITY